MSTSADISKQLESARRELLELSTTNRLLDTPRDQEKGLSLEIKDELADQVFGLLVTEGKPMRFEQGEEVQATSATDEPPAEEEPPEEAEENSKPKRKTTSRKRVTKKKAANKAASAKTQTADQRHSDNVLHTELAPEELDRRLLGLVTDAAATQQEQGVNILYLAVGFLRWLDEDKTRQAPLLLIPVRLERQNASTRFNLLSTGEDIDTNLTLKIRLKINQGIHLPTVPDVEELVPSVYFAQVRKVIADQKGWEVLDNDMLLWFFSFTKLLMYRDLEPAS
jgi:hypothetical protein